MRQKMKTLALGSKDSAFYKSISTALPFFSEIIYKSEHDFSKVSMLLEFIEKNKITQVLMPNPYGNNKRLTCYRKLKENNITIITSDRGSLPGSWFFDKGFNADSESYHYKNWNNQLSNEQKEFVEQYISKEIVGKYLEQQGRTVGSDYLRKRMKLSDDVKIIFVPFQRPNDTVIKYFSEPCNGIQGFLDLIMELDKKLNKETQKYVFILKKHPLEKEYFDIFSNNIKYTHDDANIDDLIDLSDFVLLINSGVGVLSLCKQKPVICCGNSFYAGNGLAIQAKCLDDVYTAIKNNYKPNIDSIYKFIYHLVTKVYSFGTHSTRVIKDGNSYRTITDKIIFESLIINGKTQNLNTKKVLVLSPVVPYPIYRGSQQRVDSVIRCLLQSDKYNVTLCVLNSSFNNRKSIDIANELEQHYKNLNKAVVVKDSKFFKKQAKAKHLYLTFKDRITGQSSGISNYSSCPYNYRSRVKKLISEISPDIIIANYAKLYKAIPDSFKGIKILDSHDYQSQFLMEDIESNNIQANVNLDKFRHSEHIALNTFNKVIAINPEEKIRFEKDILNPNVQCEFVPAFADKQWNVLNKFWYHNYDALFVGSVSNFNVTGLLWFLNNVMPTILKHKPDFNMAVAGNIARSPLINKEAYPNVNFLGVVSNLKYIYESSKAIITPILGGAGMKIKVIEALSYGKAIIGTSKAFEGINYSKYNAAYVVDEPVEFANKLLEIIMVDSLRIDLEENAKLLHMHEHSESAIFSKILEVVG